MGDRRLSGLCRLLAMDHQTYRSGFPDLSLWKLPDQVMIIEVKGPGDRLQNHQKVWLETLHRIGVDTRVCRVHSINECT